MNKGISNVITAALLVTVALAAVGIYSNWLPEFARNSTSSLVDGQNRAIECEKAGVSLSDVVYRESNSELSMEIKNSGTIRFSQNLTVSVINSSQIISNIKINNLAVSETETVEEVLDKKPDLILVTSKKCPDMSIRRDQISIQ